MKTERGFTLVEILVAAGIFAIGVMMALGATRLVAGALRSVATAQRGLGAVERSAAEMRNEAATAVAVFVPAIDMFGANNVDEKSAGHQVDFYSKGAGDSDVYWRYYFDRVERTLRRYDYSPGFPELRGVRDPHTGAIDPAAQYPAMIDVSAFSARTLEADRLADASKNPYAGLFVSAPLAYPVSLNDPARGRTVAGLIGGNRVIEIWLQNAAGARLVHVVAGTMPSGFTIAGSPLWHAILYRVDQTHRFWFGIAGKSHVWIKGRIDVTYDRWAHSAQWCDYNIYGGDASGGPGHGLDPGDPHADYANLRGAPEASAAGIFAFCLRHAGPPPKRSAIGAGPIPFRTPFPEQETPPSCWTTPAPGQRCWPADALPSWAPSPLPTDTPPPDWCATHAASPACPRAVLSAAPG